MSKLLVGLLLALTATSALADRGGYGYRGGYEHHGGGGMGWIAPLAIGGLIGYELNRQPTVIVQQPVYIQQPQVTNLNQIYGTVQTQPIYRYENIYDANCACYRQVLVQIN